MNLNPLFAVCLLGLTVNAAAESGMVGAGTQIQVLRPIEMSLINKVKMADRPAPGVVFQRGMILQNKDITVERLQNGICFVFADPKTDSDSFTIPSQIVHVSRVANNSSAEVTALDSNKKSHALLIECSCDSNQEPVLSERCLRRGFQRPSHAASLDLVPQLKLIDEQLIKTTVKSVVTH